MEIDSRRTIDPEFYNITDIRHNSYDGSLLPRYFKAFSGVPEKMHNLTELYLLIPNSVDFNNKALMYFLHFQSMLIEQVEDPYPKGNLDLDELNFDFQTYQDHEIANLQKLNYLALFEFWKDYVCLYHAENESEIKQIHRMYTRLLVMIFQHLGIKKNIEAFEWMDFRCE